MLAPSRREISPMNRTGHSLLRMRLLLLRHGQSVWNEAGRWQGQADPPLTDLGRQQASQASERIGLVDAIHASPLERAWVTAEIIAASLGVGPVQPEPGLVERFAGEWQGLTRPQIEEAYPGYLKARKRPPGWEPDHKLEDRAMTALGAIAIAHGGAESDSQVLVVGHSGVIYAIETLLGAAHTRLANLGGRWLEFGPAGWKLGERTVLLDNPTIPGQI